MSSNLAPTGSGPFFNGSPTLFARKPVVLLVCHFLQHGLEFMTSAAFKCANLIVFNGLHVCLCYANILNIHFIFIFLKSNIKN